MSYNSVYPSCDMLIKNINDVIVDHMLEVDRYNNTTEAAIRQLPFVKNLLNINMKLQSELMMFRRQQENISLEINDQESTSDAGPDTVPIPDTGPNTVHIPDTGDEPDHLKPIRHLLAGLKYARPSDNPILNDDTIDRDIKQEQVTKQESEQSDAVSGAESVAESGVAFDAESGAESGEDDNDKYKGTLMSFEWNKTYELVGVVEDSNGNAEKLIFDEKTTFTSSEESEDDEPSVAVTDKPEQESGHDEESGEEESDDEVEVTDKPKQDVPEESDEEVEESDEEVEVEVTDKPKQDVPVSENKPEAQSKEEEEQSEEEEEEQSEEEDEEEEDEEDEDEEDEEEEEEEEVESDSDDEVEETEINGKMYFTNDEKNGIIYEQDMEGDVGKKVGRFRNGVAVFNK